MSKNFRYGMTAIALALSFGSVTAHAAQTLACVGQGANLACDVSFTADPAFSNMCALGFQAGVYTIRNNTPVTLHINYIRLKNNDGFPNSAATVVTAPSNNCGSTLASGASCNIQVDLQPGSVGSYNRVLQVGINTRQFELDASAITTAVNCGPGGFPSAIPYGFTIPITCTILGATTVTNVISAGTAINGDVCTCPGTSITGFPPGVLTGTLRLDDGPACAQKADELTTFTTRAALPCITIPSQLGGQVLTPGAYCFASGAALLTGALTLNGPGEYTFITASTITTATASQVLLINGAVRDHVFWIVGSSATFGTGTRFQGNVLASASITFNTGAVLQGRAGVNTAAITLDSNQVNPDPLLP